MRAPLSGYRGPAGYGVVDGLADADADALADPFAFFFLPVADGDGEQHGRRDEVANSNDCGSTGTSMVIVPVLANLKSMVTVWPPCSGLASPESTTLGTGPLRSTRAYRQQAESQTRESTPATRPRR